MTEKEWLACEDPDRILSFLQVNDASDRLLRLFACAGCRAIWVWLGDTRSREAIEVAEKYADGHATTEELRTAASRAHDAAVSFRDKAPNDFDVSSRAFYATQAPTNAAAVVLNRCQTKARRKWVHEIFGNPFRFVAFSDAWRTSDVMLLAKGIYEEKAFDRMPILADALQDADCDDDALLAHLRDASATHVRGCWALDVVLGKR